MAIFRKSDRLLHFAGPPTNARRPRSHRNPGVAEAHAGSLDRSKGNPDFGRGRPPSKRAAYRKHSAAGFQFYQKVHAQPLVWLTTGTRWAAGLGCDVFRGRAIGRIRADTHKRSSIWGRDLDFGKQPQQDPPPGEQGRESDWPRFSAERRCGRESGKGRPSLLASAPGQRPCMSVQRCLLPGSRH